jgi:3-deoxy-D-manno-octulosonic-acid transferase
MKLLYNIGILFFSSLAFLLSPFNSKASLWVKGRRNWKEKISGKINEDDKTVWIHCASLGEFEQGRPVIEAIKKQHPEYKIVLTFFSPSGYEVRKNYQQADLIIYLPSDTPANAADFIEIINPEFVIFVKYEFWNNYISELYRLDVPLYLISSIFRPGQHFFKWYGSFFRGMLKKFRLIFVQDSVSRDLLSGIGIENVIVAGDTRFDRVIQITGSAREIPQLDLFRGGEKMFLAGSSWKRDEEIIAQYINKYPSKMKWVFAPHEIEKPNIERLEKLFKVKVVKFSEFTEEKSDSRVLIIDNIGMLSSAYRDATIAAVGGGFGKGIHNVLEPACWGIPVLFGPRHEKFMEAINLKGAGGAKSFTDFTEFEEILNLWLDNTEIYSRAASIAGKFVSENVGATALILQKIL